LPVRDKHLTCKISLGSCWKLFAGRTKPL